MRPHIIAECKISLELDVDGAVGIYPDEWIVNDDGEIDVSHDAFWIWYNTKGENRLRGYFVQDVEAIIQQGDAWDLIEIQVKENV